MIVMRVTQCWCCWYVTIRYSKYVVNIKIGIHPGRCLSVANEQH